MAKAKQQTTTEMMVELAKMFVSTDNAEPAELQAADKKVGKTKERRLEWAVNFAQQSPDIMTKADVYNSNLELALFLYPPLALTKEPVRYNASSFINPTRIPELKERFLKHIKAAATGMGFSFPVSHSCINVDESGISYHITAMAGTKEYFAAQLEHAELTLAQLIGQHWGYIGFCDPKKHGCGRYFLKSRSDREFCSKTCVNRSTTYRQRGKEPAA